MAAILSQPPKYLRSRPARAEQGSLRVDRRGGDNKAGIIRGVSVITKGEALGHGLWVDGVMLEQVADMTNDQRKGLKSRFTHPSLSGDGMGRYVGRVKDAELQGDRVVGDLHFATVSHTTPDGDLGEYLMTLAETDPEAYGLSIVFQQDEAAADEFEAEHSTSTGFSSPDPDNVNNYRHARVAELRAVDTVDEPAANPNGLFHRGEQVAIEADAVASYALGLSEKLPGDVSLGIDPDRLRQFVGRFMDAHNLHVSEIETVADETVEAVEETAEIVEETTAPEAVADTPEVGDTAATPELVAASGREEAKRFQEAFGDAGLQAWIEGKSFEEAGAAYVAELKSENESLTKRLASLSQGETEPVEFASEDKADANKKPKGLAGAIRIAGAK